MLGALDAFVSCLLRAGDRVRTGDVQLGRLTLYQLSYSRTGDENDAHDEEEASEAKNSGENIGKARRRKTAKLKVPPGE